MRNLTVLRDAIRTLLLGRWRVLAFCIPIVLARATSGQSAVIEGSVVDESGKPVANARITLTRIIEVREWRYQLVGEARTDPNGHFVLFTLASGRLFNLEVTPQNGPPLSGGFDNILAGQNRVIRGVMHYPRSCGVSWEEDQGKENTFVWPTRPNRNSVLICEG